MNKLLSRIKYPKLLLLLLTFVIAYILFRGREFVPFHNILLNLGYFGTFLAGIFFAYGFTAAPATAILLILAKEQNFVLAGLVAGLGALLSDLLLFKFVRHSFADELKQLSKERVVLHIHRLTPGFLRDYLLPVLTGFIIASPLPDEIAVSLLASSKISARDFSIISYLLNTTGIFVILTIGRFI